MTDSSSLVDLCGMDLPSQIELINQALEQASQGSISELITDQQMLATYVLPKALEVNVRCKVSPVQQKWKIELSSR